MERIGSVSGAAWPARYQLLDGLRGCAALLVVLNHVQVVSGDVGHFAVMVFFVISGYCITASAQSAGRNGLNFTGFMKRRFTRIYPPYFLAILFFVSTRVVKSIMTGHNYVSWPAVTWLQNLTLTQWVSNIFSPIPSPMQTPSLFVTAFWSLNYEEQFYLVVAAIMVLRARYAITMVKPILLLAAIGLVWNWLIPGNWICGFFLEYWAHFALGSILFFVLTIQPRSRLIFVMAMLALCTITFARIRFYGQPDSIDAMRAMWELLFLGAAMLMLYLLRPVQQSICASIIWRPFALLGTISYSLYLIHQFNLVLVATVAHRLLPTGTPYFIVVLTQLALFIILATGFWWICERPFLPRKLPSRDVRVLEDAVALG